MPMRGGAQIQQRTEHMRAEVTAVFKDCPNGNLALLGRVATTESLSTSADTAVPKTTTALTFLLHY